MVDEAMEVAQDPIIAIGASEQPIDQVWAREVETILRDFRLVKLEQGISLISQQLSNVVHR
jgi:hypothetical protein